MAVAKGPQVVPGRNGASYSERPQVAELILALARDASWGGSEQLGFPKSQSPPFCRDPNTNTRSVCVVNSQRYSDGHPPRPGARPHFSSSPRRNGLNSPCPDAIRSSSSNDNLLMPRKAEGLHHHDSVSSPSERIAAQRGDYNLGAPSTVATSRKSFFRTYTPLERAWYSPALQRPYMSAEASYYWGPLSRLFSRGGLCITKFGIV